MGQYMAIATYLCISVINNVNSGKTNGHTAPKLSLLSKDCCGVLSCKHLERALRKSETSGQHLLTLLVVLQCKAKWL